MAPEGAVQSPCTFQKERGKNSSSCHLQTLRNDRCPGPSSLDAGFDMGPEPTFHICGPRSTEQGQPYTLSTLHIA